MLAYHVQDPGLEPHTELKKISASTLSGSSEIENHAVETGSLLQSSTTSYTVETLGNYFNSLCP
jgi:hypothetical protein